MIPVVSRPGWYWMIILVVSGAAYRFSAGASSLDTLFFRGDSTLAVTWTPDSVNTRLEWYAANGSECTGADSVYRHCDFLPGRTYRSVAYSYGGEDGFLRFREKISEGFVVGSHLCHYNTFGDPSKAVAGTDCSGFVCYLLEAPRVSTREFYSQYTAIGRADIDVGDIIVKPGSHAVIVVEKEDENNFLIWESTSVVNGCRERMIDITDSYWDAYYPRRYPGLAVREQTAAPDCPAADSPHVSTNRNSLLVSSPAGWQGTVSVFSLQGRVVHTSRHTIENGSTAIITLPETAASFIIRIQSAGRAAVSRYFSFIP